MSLILKIIYLTVHVHCKIIRILMLVFLIFKIYKFILPIRVPALRICKFWNNLVFFIIDSSEHFTFNFTTISICLAIGFNFIRYNVRPSFSISSRPFSLTINWRRNPVLKPFRQVC